MNSVQEYRNPLLIGAAAVVVAILLYVLVISPQNSKLSTLQAQQVTLQAQQASLQSQLTVLQNEKQKVSANCADLQKISTQIPSVLNAGDLAAEQSSFYNQLTALVGSSGTSFSTFAFTASSASSSSASSSAGSSSAGVVPVPVTLTVTGNFGQMTAFVSGLDSFPRLFVIQTFTLSFGAPAAGAAPSTGGGSASASESAPALWTGGIATPATTGPYTLAIAGSIYYTSTPNALAACTAATTATTTK